MDETVPQNSQNTLEQSGAADATSAETDRTSISKYDRDQVHPKTEKESSAALHSKKSWKEKLLEEVIEVGTVMGYLAVSFCILQTFRCTTLLVACSQNDFMTSYATALISSVALGKFVFVLEKMPLARRFEDQPLIYPVLYKSVLFTALVNVIMHFEERLLHHDKGATPASNPETFWPCFLAHQLAFFVTFIVFFSFRAVGTLVGKERLRREFFISRD